MASGLHSLKMLVNSFCHSPCLRALRPVEVHTCWEGRQKIGLAVSAFNSNPHFGPARPLQIRPVPPLRPRARRIVCASNCTPDGE